MLCAGAVLGLGSSNALLEILQGWEVQLRLRCCSCSILRPSQHSHSCISPALMCLRCLCLLCRESSFPVPVPPLPSLTEAVPLQLSRINRH